MIVSFSLDDEDWNENFDRVRLMEPDRLPHLTVPNAQILTKYMVNGKGYVEDNIPTLPSTMVYKTWTVWSLLRSCNNKIN